MRIIENRTGNKLNNPLRILSFLRGRWDGQRFPALQALADQGHEIIYVDKYLPVDSYRKLVKRLKIDVAVLWGNSLQNILMSSSEQFFLDEMQVPYISLWTDNPVKHLFLLKDLSKEFHRAMFIADTKVIKQLTKLGYQNLFYMPPWHIDPEIFKPTLSDPKHKCEISFAATVNSYDAERNRWRTFWNFHMNSAADEIIEALRHSGNHVDVFDALADKWDPQSLPFSLISHAMYFEQKAIAREQVVNVVGDREIHITGIGSAQFDKGNVVMHEGLEWYELSPVFNSATVNLNLTPWPRSCHHRVFQITASRALAVTDWREDALDLYEPDTEVVYFKSIKELPDILDRFTTHPDEAKVISQSGYQRFLAHHTVNHRMAELNTLLYQLI